jgi:hypothetical protein
MISAPVVTFNYEVFQVQIPEYSNTELYPETSVDTFWDLGSNYISQVNYGSLKYSSRVFALNLMCAHLIYLNDLIAAGQKPFISNEATIDKISVGLVPPPIPNQFQFWLGTSPRGMQLMPLLEVSSVGGFVVGGSSVLADFGYFQNVRGYYGV